LSALHTTQASAPRNVACLALIAAFASLTACTPPRTSRPRDLTPPVFFDEAAWDDEAFKGKSMAEIRRLMKGALDTPVTLSVRSATIQTVARELSEKAGLGIGITPDVCTACHAKPIDLDVHQMPARHVLDWVTRLIGAYYAVEGPQAVFITRNRNWASQHRLKMQSYAVGALLRIDKPTTAKYNISREAENLLYVLNYCLRHTMRGNPDAKLLLDATGSRLTANLPPRGHTKLKEIIAELKKERKYRPPATKHAVRETADLLTTRLVCNFARQDVRRIADELGRRTGVNVGFNYRRIADQHRTAALALGETTLANALDALAKAAGLGQVVPEPGRRVWILAQDQEPSLLRRTGVLPWDRATTRSYYVKPLVDDRGVDLLFNVIKKTVTPGEWDGDLPVAFYHSPTGRLLVVHEPAAQRDVAKAIEWMRNVARPSKPGGK